MTPYEAEAVVAIATLAALADGQQDPQEQAAIGAVATQLGLAAETLQRAAAGHLPVADLASRFTSDESRQTAYDAALSVCTAGGQPSVEERTFLVSLARTLNISEANAVNPFADAMTAAPSAAMLAHDPAIATLDTPRSNVVVSNLPVSNVTVSNVLPPEGSPLNAAGLAGATELDNHILDQAILTAAMELLPDRLANMAILPLQMRLVYGIGQRHGQSLDMRQAADLAATFGIGAAAQVFEKVVRRALGGIAGGLLGGMFGGATGIAAGAAVTFASTYALGHAAEQYYAQGRKLSVADMKALFARFQSEATAMYPRVQERVQQRAGGTSLSSVMQSLRR